MNLIPALTASPTSYQSTNGVGVTVSFQEFTSQYTSFQGTGQDASSGIREYQYAVGTREDEFAFSGGWNSVFSTSSTIDHDVPYSELGRENPQDKSSVYVRLRVRNGYGLWSTVDRTGSILVDRSAPTVPAVTKSRYSIFDYQVTGVGLSSSDLESGVSHYRIAVVNDPAISELPAETGTVVSGFQTTLDLSDLVIGGLSLQDAGTYYIAVQTRNGAGDWSAVGLSNEFIVDITEPVLQFAQEYRVVNSVPATIAFDLSEESTVQFVVTDPQGASAPFDLGKLPAVVPGSFDYQPEPPAYGTHTFSAIVTDLAGNVGNQGPDASVMALRVNSPPVVILPFNYVTRPGAPLTIVPLQVYDPDGDALSYLWSLGPPGASTDANPIVSYVHIDPMLGVTEYDINLTVTDAYGLSTSATSTVTVNNSRSGVLYVDEYWLDGHLVTGDITVPAGIVLTVAPAANVIAVADELTQPRITVEGVLSASGTIIRGSAGNTARWAGLLVSGSADLTGSLVSGADRGLTLVAGGAALLDTTAFQVNRIGAHFVGVSPTVEWCSFIDNEHYGIKEDAGANPHVTNSYFHSNGYAYYDEDLTVVSVDELNGLGSNVGNTGE